jgi:hypothetical protein
MFRSVSCLGLRSFTQCRLADLASWVVALLVGLFVCLASATAQQATTPIQRSYINPFPNGDRYRVLVVGDSLGDGLWSGLYRAFEDDATLEFIQRAKNSTGFARPDSYDWNNELTDILKQDTYQIAVIMFGDNDAQPIKSGKDWLKVGSEGWREIYGQRVEAFIKKLRAANIAVSDAASLAMATSRVYGRPSSASAAARYVSRRAASSRVAISASAHWIA